MSKSPPLKYRFKQTEALKLIVSLVLHRVLIALISLLAVACATPEHLRTKEGSITQVSSQIVPNAVNEKVEKRFTELLQNSAKSEVERQTYLFKEFDLFARSNRTRDLSYYIGTYQGLLLMKDKTGVVTQDTLDKVRESFVQGIKYRVKDGSFTDLLTNSNIKIYFAELLNPEQLRELTSQSIANLSNRFYKGDFDGQLELIKMADQFATPTEIRALKNYLSEHTVSYTQLAELNQTKNFKIDESKFPQTIEIGDFQSSAMGRLGSDVQKIVRTGLKDFKDPDSVKFRAVRTIRIGSNVFVCGELNGVNSYGAYVGYKYFIGDLSRFSIEEKGVSPQRTEVNYRCDPNRYSLEQLKGSDSLST